eukprot:1152384-Pelagomonas_calceolata.AAC.2
MAIRRDACFSIPDSNCRLHWLLLPGAVGEHDFLAAQEGGGEQNRGLLRCSAYCTTEIRLLWRQFVVLQIKLDVSVKCITWSSLMGWHDKKPENLDNRALWKALNIQSQG